MPQYILILTQDTQNKSVCMLEAELKKNSDQAIQILNWDLNQVMLTANGISLKTYSVVNATIAYADIALVVKRTWGPARKKALAICQDLERRGVPVLNTCDFIAWSHSKISQFETLQDTQIFPATVCFAKDFFNVATEGDLVPLVHKVLAAVQAKLSFPLVYKTAEGCRTNGVYLITSPAVLTNLLSQQWLAYQNGQHPEFDSGFLLQEFIVTHDDPTISNYYRVNLVNGKPQSAVQFQLQWQRQDGEQASLNVGQRLQSFAQAVNKPIALDFFPSACLQAIASACPVQNGVVGADIIKTQDKLYLLEYNDGPVLSEIVELAQQNAGPLQVEANAQCGAFIKAIANLCLGKLALHHEMSLSEKRLI